MGTKDAHNIHLVMIGKWKCDINTIKFIKTFWLLKNEWKLDKLFNKDSEDEMFVR